MKTIDTATLQKDMKSDQIALFDVRGDVEFEEGHIPGAKTAPLGSLTFRVARIMNPESKIAVYASGKDNTLAKEAVERLENLGLRNVFCYEEGFEGWRAAGHPVTTPSDAKSHVHGPVESVRPLVVDREKSYGGAFKDKPEDVGGAGG